MNPVEFAVWAFWALMSLVFYKILSMNLALAARESMVPFVAQILGDEKLPVEVKQFALGSFHLSLSPWFLPSLIWFSLFSFLRKKKVPQEFKNSEHAKVYDSLVRQHLFRINVLAAPHWYILFLLLFAIVVVFVALITLGLQSGERVYSGIRAILTPEPFVLKESEKPC